MKTVRSFFVFPLDVALIAAAMVLLLSEFVCRMLIKACQLVEGRQ